MSQCCCNSRDGHLLGIGNPLLDISATVGLDLLAKYGMTENIAIMAEEKHMPLYKELVEKYNAEFLAGGSAQNSLRVAQWILKEPNVTTYLGCVGNDDFATKLRERATADGVQVHYQVTSDAPTGTCAVLITGTKRSLCANLAAAQKFTESHLDQPECKKSIEKAKIIYASGFFVVVSPESCMRLARHMHDNQLWFAMNLSAPFVSQFYKEPLEKLLPYVDVLFGNETEAEAFATAFGIEDKDMKSIGLKMAAMPKLSSRERVVVITQGSDPVILVQGTNVEIIHVVPLPPEKIVDTNGAGDAFVGGFLSQMVLQNPYTTAVKCGIYTANHVIQHSGCSFSGTSDFKS